MPGPDRANQKTGVVREIYFFKPVKSANQKRGDKNGLYKSVSGKLVAKTKSDETGHFEVRLRTGRYSVFTKEENGFFANVLDGEGFVNMVEVKKNSFADLVIEINYQAAF